MSVHDNKGKNNRHIEGQWLPTTNKEIEHLGWDHVDVILFSGDAYIDHPSMGAAVIGRVLEAHGFNVAIVPQPNWRDDLRDFKKLGACSGPAIGRVGIIAATATIGGVVIHHRVHGPRAHAKKQPWRPQFLEN